MPDISPSGDEVVQTGISGLGDFFSRLGGIAVTGLSRKVDYEIATKYRVPDTSETAPLTHTAAAAPKVNTLIDTVTALTPIQMGGLAIAGGLAWALATGKFR